MRKVIIMGAAGRDFHNFNVFFKNNRSYKVVAFTATQIPNIDRRKYPSSLAGKLYPNGIPIHPESKLEDLMKRHDAHIVVFCYSDVSYRRVMEVGSKVLAAGADFMFMGPECCMLKAEVPVVAVCAVRTGCGKSQTTRKVCRLLMDKGKKVVAVRHPMPYGDLRRQVWQRFGDVKDLKKYHCTIEEREEYEPLMRMGVTVYAGVDYFEILRRAEKEGDILVWDGGNNDFPFYRPDLHIVLLDALRPGDELFYYPGEVNLRMADVAIINKIDSAQPEDVEEVRSNIAAVNPKAVVIDAASPVFCAESKKIRNKRVLVVEDGPTLTHGEMSFGAGVVAARKFGAKELVDPRPYAVGSIRKSFEKYPHIGSLLPATGYGGEQMKDLEKTINKVDCECVIVATPVNLSRLIEIEKPAVRVTYELEEIGKPDLEDVISGFLEGKR
ncbi:MAG: cyclic 2,3-diphosphoglycerate synthase [bacterium]